MSDIKYTAVEKFMKWPQSPMFIPSPRPDGTIGMAIFYELPHTPSYDAKDDDEGAR